jgi:Tol biopolymer transport system component
MGKLTATASCILVLSVLLVPAPRAADSKADGPINLTCNTADNEDDPHLSSDGRTLFYSCDAKGKVDIMVSRRATPRHVWPQGRLFGSEDGDYVQTKVDDRSTFVTTEARYPQYLFYATKKDEEVNNFDIYVAVKQGPRAAFTAPTPVSTIDTKEDELHPWLTPDGKRLYFSRKTKDGWRVLVASRTTTTGAAGFAAPVLLEDLPAGFHHPTLSPDGKTMYLQGPLAKDRWGLFVTTGSGTKWARPEPLTINSSDAPTGDLSPSLSRDGKLLYFASDRPGGKGKLDLWVIQTAKLKSAKSK